MFPTINANKNYLVYMSFIGMSDKHQNNIIAE